MKIKQDIIYPRIKGNIDKNAKQSQDTNNLEPF